MKSKHFSDFCQISKTLLSLAEENFPLPAETTFDELTRLTYKKLSYDEFKEKKKIVVHTLKYLGDEAYVSVKPAKGEKEVSESSAIVKYRLNEKSIEILKRKQVISFKQLEAVFLGMSLINMDPSSLNYSKRS